MSTHGLGHAITDKNEVVVSYCPCGVVHLTFGASTVNISAQLIPWLANALNTTASELRGFQEPEAASPKPTNLEDAQSNIVFGSFPKL